MAGLQNPFTTAMDRYCDGSWRRCAWISVGPKFYLKSTMPVSSYYQACWDSWEWLAPLDVQSVKILLWILTDWMFPELLHRGSKDIAARQYIHYDGCWLISRLGFWTGMKFSFYYLFAKWAPKYLKFLYNSWSSWLSSRRGVPAWAIKVRLIYLCSTCMHLYIFTIKYVYRSRI